MALEVVERLKAILASVQGFAGSGAELADERGPRRTATRTIDRFRVE